MFQAVLPEQGGAFLGLLVNVDLGRLAHPGRLEPFCQRGIRETNSGGLVQVIQHLAQQAVAVQVNRFEIALVEQGFDQAGQEILRGFQGKKSRRLLGVGKTGQLGRHRPEQLHHALAQAAQGDDIGRSAGRKIRLAQRIVIGNRQRSLRDQDEDFFGRDAGIQQVPQALHPGCRFAAACRTLQEQAPLDWAADYVKLVPGKS